MAWADLTHKLLGVAMRTFATPTDVSYTPDGLAEITDLKAIFRRDAEVVDAATGARVATEGPVLDVRILDLGQDPSPADRCVVPAIPGVHPTSQRYAVHQVFKDGEGSASLLLHEKTTG